MICDRRKAPKGIGDSLYPISTKQESIVDVAGWTVTAFILKWKVVGWIRTRGLTGFASENLIRTSAVEEGRCSTRSGEQTRTTRLARYTPDVNKPIQPKQGKDVSQCRRTRQDRWSPEAPQAWLLPFHPIRFMSHHALYSIIMTDDDPKLAVLLVNVPDRRYPSLPPPTVGGH